MKLRTQIMALGLIGVALSVLIGSIGLISSARLGHQIEEAVAGAETLQASQEADMMHDAVRGDVLLALLGATNKDVSQVKEAQDGLKEHTTTMLKNLDILSKANLPPQVAAKVKESVPMVQQYLANGDSVIKLAGSSAEQAHAAIPAFQAAFNGLEKQLGEQGEAIEKAGRELNTRVNSGVTSTQTIIGATMAIGAALAVAIALWLATLISRPVARAVEMAQPHFPRRSHHYSGTRRQ